MAYIGLPLPIKLKRIEKAREKVFCFCVCYDGQVMKSLLSDNSGERTMANDKTYTAVR
jgi:hypothetical protein